MRDLDYHPLITKGFKLIIFKEEVMRPGKLTKTSKRRNERGNVLVYTVLSALFLFMAVGLGVDLSHLYAAKAELQNAADAGALAGASALTLPNDQKITTAVTRALDTLNLNKYNFDNRTFAATMGLAAQENLVTFAVNLDGPYISKADAEADPEDIRFIRVQTPPVPIRVFFATPFLGSSTPLDAKAIAGLSIPGNVRFCPAPLAAVECNPAVAACEFDPRLWGSCPVTVSQPDANGIQTYADGTTCNPKKTFCRGCVYTIRFAGGNFNSPGNFGALDCGGKLIDNLAAYGDSCKCGNLSAGDSITIDTKTGVNAGPIAGGLNVRFDIYGHGLKEMDWEDIPPDKNIEDGTPSGEGANEEWSGITYQQYLDSDPFRGPSGGKTGVGGRRVLVIPTTLHTTWTNGSSTITVNKMAAFFMRSRANDANGDIKAEYVENKVTGITGSDPDSSTTSNIVTPVLYR